MYEIATLKNKKLPELQEIAKLNGVKRITGLKKMELIYQIIDIVAEDTRDNNEKRFKNKIEPHNEVQDKIKSKKIENDKKIRKVEYKKEDQTFDKKEHIQ